MVRRSLWGLAVVLAATGIAGADTIRLKNNVCFDGVVTERPDGTLVIHAGQRTLVYQKAQIKSIEKNARTGEFDKEQAMARWAQRDAELTGVTGLTAIERGQVKALMFKLKGDPAHRKAARDKLVTLQQEMDVFRYLAYELPRLSHRVSPWVLEAMFYVDATRIMSYLRTNTQHEHYGTRAKAIELLGKLRDYDSVYLIVRGLADHANEVRVAAAYSLANIRAKIATPALIECLKDADLRVASASRQALLALWREEIGEEKLRSVEEFEAFWTSQAGSVGKAITLGQLLPHVSPEEEFEDE